MKSFKAIWRWLKGNSGPIAVILAVITLLISLIPSDKYTVIWWVIVAISALMAIMFIILYLVKAFIKFNSFLHEKWIGFLRMSFLEMLDFDVQGMEKDVLGSAEVLGDVQGQGTGKTEQEHIGILYRNDGVMAESIKPLQRMLLKLIYEIAGEPKLKTQSDFVGSKLWQAGQKRRKKQP